VYRGAAGVCRDRPRASAGGYRFHWWCHALLHWNIPASPIDREQREGRIHRYDGHAARLNIAQQHGETVLRADDDDAAHRIAAEESDGRLGTFALHWVYHGGAKIERHVDDLPQS